MINTTPQNENFKKRLNNNRDVIINHIRKVHPKSFIQIMTNKDETLNRGKHFGAHILVSKSHYYYITFSRKDENCEFYFSINENLLKSLKHCKEDWHLLLISNGKVHTFDAKTIVDNAKLFNGTTYKIPLSVENSCTDADYRYSYDKETEYKVDFKFIGNVRYNKKFDMHKTKCCLIYDHASRILEDGRETEAIHISKVFSTVKDLYDFLKKCDVFSKPMSMRVFYKYLKRGFVETNINGVKERVYLVTEKAACQPQFSSCYPKAVAHCALSLLVVDYNSTNKDSAQQAVHQNKDNNKKDGGKNRLDKQLNTIAEKLVEKESTKYTPAEISKYVASLGSNKNMLDVYIESLTKKGLQKEAAYAAKVFDALNNIDFN